MQPKFGGNLFLAIGKKWVVIQKVTRSRPMKFRERESIRFADERDVGSEEEEWRMTLKCLALGI